MKKIEIEIPDGKRAEWVNGVLTLVDDTPKDIIERIKTFDDACKELGNNHPFVCAYNGYAQNVSEEIKNDTDIIAYLKLRIITAALNEGWKPEFKDNEQRWYPSFTLWTEEELSEKGDEWKADRHLISTGNYSCSDAGFAFSLSDSAPSYANTYFGSHLCFKSKALATYCGKQFISLWADFNLIKSNKQNNGR
nr:MAG TPA: hypothetical protein [Bacteriophage sp.]